MKMNALYAALSGAFLLGAATLAPAQSSTPGAPAGSTLTNPVKNAKVATSDAYRADKDRIEADAKSAKEKCKSMSGNAKDICQAEAKANEKVAKAELEAKRKGTPHSQYEADKTKVEGTYEVAKEKCEDQKGAEMAACKKAAKADKDKAMAQLKANRKNVATAPSGSAGTTKKSDK